ncbi:MAG: hypothetical protein IIB94_01405 [Candidatus Marinimicrobia bacterium]|nr:hypothetical protein [Candidatus Neomarinimicrobiota bacterium]
MQVSGFSFVRNGIKLGYPVTEAIRSILPICDEFIIAVGKSEDDTLEQIKAIGDSKIRIIETEWDKNMFVRGQINSFQTNIALKECIGDWCFYIQADEVVHEKFLPLIEAEMKKFLHDDDVQGLLFDYLHFWGSYDYYQDSRRWYRHEIRIIKNNLGIESWESAQGFRRIGRKVRVVKIDADIYHYGWVRPPKVMKEKQIAFQSLRHDEAWLQKTFADTPEEFDYGDPKYLAKFEETHPEVMTERIKELNWDFSKGKYAGNPHEKLFSRIRSYFEDKVIHYRIGEYKNYILLKNK